MKREGRPAEPKASAPEREKEEPQFPKAPLRSFQSKLMALAWGSLSAPVVPAASPGSGIVLRG